jgi:hypothetical protein
MNILKEYYIYWCGQSGERKWWNYIYGLLYWTTINNMDHIYLTSCLGQSLIFCAYNKLQHLFTSIFVIVSNTWSRRRAGAMNQTAEQRIPTSSPCVMHTTKGGSNPRMNNSAHSTLREILATLKIK